MHTILGYQFEDIYGLVTNKLPFFDDEVLTPEATDYVKSSDRYDGSRYKPSAIYSNGLADRMSFHYKLKDLTVLDFDAVKERLGETEGFEIKIVVDRIGYQIDIGSTELNRSICRDYGGTLTKAQEVALINCVIELIQGAENIPRDFSLPTQSGV